MRFVPARTRRRAPTSPLPTRRPHACEPLEPRTLLAGAATSFAVIGDYGFPAKWDETVADLVKGWDPAFVITTGDNNYPTGSAQTIDYHIGRLYHPFIYNYRGIYGPGSPTRRFFPSLGNHDWGEPVINPDGAGAYLDYFDLPGNERYYEFAFGPVRMFCLDSDRNEPDGVAADSVQAQWLRGALAAATEPWKIVYFHHAPYSSGHHHGDSYMRWPFRGWGATAVMGGHDHHYERLDVGGLPYFISALGGAPRYIFQPHQAPDPFSQVRYDAGYGAMRVDATEDSIRFQFVAAEDGRVVDSYTLLRPDAPGGAPPAAPEELTARRGSDVRIDLAWADRSVDESGFEIERSTDGGWRFDRLVTVDRDTTRFSDHDVTPSRAYHYRVRAVNAAGESSFADAGAVGARVLSPVAAVPAGAVWRFRDDGSDQGAAWQDPNFDDSGWAAGPGELGYAEGDERTPVAYGPSLDERHITTYFRHAFNAPADPRPPAALRLRLLADDGAIVYLNGQEAFRWNMPAGPVNHLTRAAGGLKFLEELEWRTADLPASLLFPGRNVLAVEVHQYSTTRFPHDEPDLSFNLELLAVVDGNPPVAALAPPPPVIPGSVDHAFEITYVDDVGLRVPLPGPIPNVVVTGPNGYSRPASLLRAVPAADGRTLATTYSVRAPGDEWDPADAGVYAVSLAGGVSVTDTSGNTPAPGTLGTFAWGVAPASLAGRLFVDEDRDTLPDAGATPLAGWRVYLDSNSSGALEPGEATAETGADGAYGFAGLAPGRHVVRPAPRSGWKLTPPGVAEVTLSPGEQRQGHDFGAAQTARISGGVFDDANGDGYWGAGDAPAAGRTVFLDLDDNGEHDPAEPSTLSAATGAFRFEGLTPGTYLVRQVLPPGRRPTAPRESAVQPLTLAPGDAAGPVSLGSAPIFAIPGGPYTVAEGGAVTLNAGQSAAPGSTVRGYEWDFDYDGRTFTPDSPRLAGADAVFRATTDDGNDAAARQVAVRVYDALGSSAVGVTTVRVTNVAPAVSAGPDGISAVGAPFSLAGAFTDPGPDSWSATVDWGDGPRPLPLRPDRTFVASHAFTAPGTYTVTVAVADDDGGTGTDTVVVQVTGTGVVGRYAFYNHSAFDGNDPAANQADDTAIAVDKAPLLPGRPASFANVTSYLAGINGIMIDLVRPAGAAVPGPEDLEFRAGVGDLSAWPVAPAPSDVTLRRGAGVGGSDRMTLAWPDGTILNRWLQVTVLASDRTGLSAPDVFYFGNLAGETGAAAPGDTRIVVNALDLAALKRNLTTAAVPVTSPADLNRDGRVNAQDIARLKANLQRSLDAFTPPAPLDPRPTEPAGAASVLLLRTEDPPVTG